MALLTYRSIQYSVAIIQLLAPLASSGYFSENDVAQIRDTITQHAQAGLQLVEHGNRLYSSRYCMPIIAFCILHLGDALLHYSLDTYIGATVVPFCLNMLQQNQAGFPVCGPLQQLFRQNAKMYIESDSDVKAMVESDNHYGVDDILDACTRLEYSQPVDLIRRYIDRGVGDHWAEEWRKQMNVERPRRHSTTERSMLITSVLNDD